VTAIVSGPVSPAGRRSTACAGQTSIADRAEWDNHYIENWSLGFDLIILALTVRAVFVPSES
jgi:lipopolysaccharide/colanic/teichoic acid biosynthesis glycosyltransferase